MQSLPAPVPTTVVVAPKSDAGTSTIISDRKALLTAVVTPVREYGFFFFLCSFVFIFQIEIIFFSGYSARGR